MTSEDEKSSAHAWIMFLEGGPKRVEKPLKQCLQTVLTTEQNNFCTLEVCFQTHENTFETM